MRGTPVRPSFRGPECRFIPAHAGNSAARSPPPGRCSVHPRACGELAARGRADHAESAVHPRACGELVSIGASFVTSTGSSPRMRGTPGFHCGPTEEPPVHPRACGELGPDQEADSSSPTLRGTRHLDSRQQPAQPVHPRACGETRDSRPSVHPRACCILRRCWCRQRFIPAHAGSSPRMRGTLFLETHDSKRFARP